MSTQVLDQFLFIQPKVMPVMLSKCSRHFAHDRVRTGAVSSVSRSIPLTQSTVLSTLDN